MSSMASRVMFRIRLAGYYLASTALAVKIVLSRTAEASGGMPVPSAAGLPPVDWRAAGAGSSPRAGRVARWSTRLWAAHDLLRARALNRVLDRIGDRKPAASEPVCAYLSARAGRQGLAPASLVVAARAALLRGDADEVKSLLEQLAHRFPTRFALHQRAAAFCFHEGEYALAEWMWKRSDDLRDEQIEGRGLHRLNLRFLGASWFMAIGHVAHLDSYFKNNKLHGHDDRRTVLAPSAAGVQPNGDLWRHFQPFLSAPTDDMKRLSNEDIECLTDEFWNLRLGPGHTRMFSHAGAIVQSAWAAQGLPPIVSLAAEDRRRGHAVLGSLDIPQDAWYVCFHVREPGFHGAWHRRHPGTRNADVDTYLRAMHAVTERGGYVVRMGDPTMKPLPAMPRVIDYAHRPEKSAFMDVFLAATCRFFVGTNSGLGLLPSVFGVRCAMSNWTPAALPQWYPGDLSIPKLVASPALGRCLGLQEMLAGGAGWAQFESWYARRGLVLVDNTDDDLVDLVEDAFDLLDGRDTADADRARQASWRDLLCRAGSYDGARPGARFLRKHAGTLRLDDPDSFRATRLQDSRNTAPHHTDPA